MHSKTKEKFPKKVLVQKNCENVTLPVTKESKQEKQQKPEVVKLSTSATCVLFVNSSTCCDLQVVLVNPTRVVSESCHITSPCSCKSSE